MAFGDRAFGNRRMLPLGLSVGRLRRRASDTKTRQVQSAQSAQPVAHGAHGRCCARVASVLWQKSKRPRPWQKLRPCTQWQSYPAEKVHMAHHWVYFRSFLRHALGVVDIKLHGKPRHLRSRSASCPKVTVDVTQKVPPAGKTKPLRGILVSKRNSTGDERYSNRWKAQLQGIKGY